ARWAKSEGELFPGATIAILALAGALAAWWQAERRPDRLERVSRWLLLPAAVCGAIALLGWTRAPWHLTIAGISISSDAPYKPLTLALAAVMLALGCSSRFRAAFARRSRLAFYCVAATLLFLCSLGPKPTLAGHQFLYEPPYAWLMRLPVFDSIRAPARFGAV